MKEASFAEARREIAGLTARVERRVLAWLVARVPPWLNSDHLTALGLFGMVGAGAAYRLSGLDGRWLYVVNACLALNWLGDSLDGTLARYRNRCRPRYGFYVDHMGDMFGVLFLLAGLGSSGHMTPAVAVAVLLTYYLMSIHVFLATHVQGVFKLTYGALGGTELRLLLMAGNLALPCWPRVELAGRELLLYDVVGAAAATGLFLTAVVSALRSTRDLYRLERV